MRSETPGGMDTELRLPALQIRQGTGREIYCFGVDGKLLPSFTTVSRVKRDDGEIQGYQRPEVLSHIDEIKRYLESPDPMLPNALVIAFDGRVRFEPQADWHSGCSRLGTLVIPFDTGSESWTKPGWIVDGQQRAAAIRQAGVESFPVCITAFISSAVAEQRLQFILVNSVKPLPKGLLYELLPTTAGNLPRLLSRRRLPALLLERLNYDSDSPLRLMISTPTTPEGVIKDNSILRMLENSIGDGALYSYRDPHSGDAEVEPMLRLVKAFWKAVSQVFPEAWNLPPTRSRLTHGVGIISLGFVMDAISDRLSARDDFPSVESFATELMSLKGECHWASGYWDFGPLAQRRWNELQNTPKDIQVLANHLLVKYRLSVLEFGATRP